MAANNYYQRTVLKESLYSEQLGKERSFRIFLPPGFNELVTYPVIYFQDGVEAFNFGRAATHAMKLILDDGCEPFLIVGVDVDMPNRTAEYAPEGRRFDAYSRFFLEELIPFVESRYAVRERILAGDSLGGTVSLHLSLQAPNSIPKVISLSGAFLSPSLEAVQEAGDLSWLQVYQIIGTEETAVETSRGTYDFLGANRQMKAALQQRGANVVYVEKPGTHTWGLWQNELPAALRWAVE